MYEQAANLKCASSELKSHCTVFWPLMRLLFQHKSSPLNSFGSRQPLRKPTLFESRFCKELMGQNFDKVRIDI